MPNFTRTIEDFTCEHCGTQVTGDGFTNHCPACLWSKHVDNDPGDRANDCHGMMEPIDIELDHGESIIIHQCTKCKAVKKNKSINLDDHDAIISVINKKSH